jgi:hypothetical protein
MSKNLDQEELWRVLSELKKILEEEGLYLEEEFAHQKHSDPEVFRELQEEARVVLVGLARLLPKKMAIKLVAELRRKFPPKES